MSVNLYDSGTGKLKRIAGLADGSEIKESVAGLKQDVSEARMDLDDMRRDVDGIMDVVPGSASTENMLAVKSDLDGIAKTNIVTTHSADKNLDFNDFKGESNTVINYWLRYGDTWDNCPASTFGSVDWIVLTVENASGRVQQTVLIQKTTNRSERWTRCFIYGDPTGQTVWSDWVKLATSEDIVDDTQWVAGTSTRVYRKVEIKGNSTFSGVIQLVTKSGDVYYVSKRDGSSIKFTKVVDGVGGDAVAISGYEFDSANYVLTLYLTMDAWSAIRIDVLNAWSKEGQKNTTITITSITQSEISGTVPTIVNAVVSSDLTPSVASGNTSPVTSGGVYTALNTVSYGTATRNSATMSASSFVGKWHRCGKLVMAEVQGITVASEFTSDFNLMTGFPKPLENVALVAQGGSNTSATGIVLKTDGALRSHYNMAASTFFHATFTYITSE